MNFVEQRVVRRGQLNFGDDPSPRIRDRTKIHGTGTGIGIGIDVFY